MPRPRGAETLVTGKRGGVLEHPLLIGRDGWFSVVNELLYTGKLFVKMAIPEYGMLYACGSAA